MVVVAGRLVGRVSDTAFGPIPQPSLEVLVDGFAIECAFTFSCWCGVILLLSQARRLLDERISFFR